MWYVNGQPSSVLLLYNKSIHSRSTLHIWMSREIYWQEKKQRPDREINVHSIWDECLSLWPRRNSDRWIYICNQVCCPWLTYLRRREDEAHPLVLRPREKQVRSFPDDYSPTADGNRMRRERSDVPTHRRPDHLTTTTTDWSPRHSKRTNLQNNNHDEEKNSPDNQRLGLDTNAEDLLWHSMSIEPVELCNANESSTIDFLLERIRLLSSVCWRDRMLLLLMMIVVIIHRWRCLMINCHRSLKHRSVDRWFTDRFRCDETRRNSSVRMWRRIQLINHRSNSILRHTHRRRV